MAELQRQLVATRDVFKRLGEAEHRLRQRLHEKKSRAPYLHATPAGEAPPHSSEPYHPPHLTSPPSTIPAQSSDGSQLWAVPPDDTALPASSSGGISPPLLGEPVECPEGTPPLTPPPPPREQNLQVLAEKAGWRCRNNDSRLLATPERTTVTTLTSQSPVRTLEHLYYPRQRSDGGSFAASPARGMGSDSGTSSLERALGLPNGGRVRQPSPAAAGPVGGEEPTLMLTMVLQGGREVALVVREADEPGRVAEDFLARHALPPALLAPVTERIRAGLQALRKEAAVVAAAPSPSPPPAPPQSRRQGARRSPSPRHIRGAAAGLQGMRPARAASASRAVGPNGGRGGSPTARQRRAPLAVVDPNAAGRQARAGKASPQRGAVPRSSSAPVCERLYAMALQKQKRSADSVERHRAQRDEEARQQATFSPRISSAAKKLSRRQAYMVSSQQRRIAVLRADHETQEMQQCTFAPQLSQRSKKLVKTMRCESVSPDVAFQSLYLDAEMRKIRSSEREACARFT